MRRQNVNTQTRLCALFGHPVKHSFSPLMHNSAFRYLGLNYIYAAFDIEPRNLEVAVNAVKVLNLAGVNITIPHKEKVICYLDSIDPFAELTGAVNTVSNTEGKLTGYNTDGPGFICSLEEDCSFDVRNKTVLLVGAGGAARAVGIQLALSGASAVGILNRNQQRGALLAKTIQDATGIETVTLPWPREKHPVLEKDLTSFFQNADLVVNCTPVGMYGVSGQLPPLPYHLARCGQVAYDLVYNPPETRFLAKFRQSGCSVANGIGMLLYQGVLAFEQWTGHRAPVQVMRESLIKCLE